MLYAPQDLTQVMGIGSYVGELRRGPDGNLYEWAAGVDGLGNPIGFWKKRFRAIKRAARRFARAGLARLIPGPLKRVARRVCANVAQMGPAVTVVPTAAPYYAGARGLCRVLRGAGIAGVGYVMETPEGAEPADAATAPVTAPVVAPAPTPLVAPVTPVVPVTAPVAPVAVPIAPVTAPAAAAMAIPPGARAAARSVCGVINRLGPVLKYIPVAGSYYRRASGLCTALRSAGIAGMNGPIMEAPGGQLYEVIEGIGEFGERQRQLRPVRLVIPAYIGRRGRGVRGGVRRAQRVQPIVAASTTAPAPAPSASAAVNGFGYFY